MTLGELARAVMAELGPEDRAAVRDVRLFAKPRPDALDLARGCTPDQQAAFYGVGRELGQLGRTELPDPRPAEGDITLFLANLAPLTVARVRTALVHELGHALGLDEGAIQGLGLHLGDKEEGACCC